MGLSAGGIRRRNRVLCRSVEITSAEPVVSGQIVVQLDNKFVGVERTGSRSLPAIIGHVRNRDSGEARGSATGIQQFLRSGVKQRGANHRRGATSILARPDRR